MAREFVKTVDFSRLQPVDSNLLHFYESQNDATRQIIQNNALSFAGKDLLSLNRKQIIAITDRLRGQFASIAAGRRLAFDRQDLESLKDSDENALLHELEHLKIIVVLRPELIDDITINILAVLEANRLKMAMNVMTTIPELDYSVSERAKIMMAPVSPSDQDYLDLYRYIKSHPITFDEIGQIRKMVIFKKESKGKAEMIRYLDSFK